MGFTSIIYCSIKMSMENREISLVAKTTITYLLSCTAESEQQETSLLIYWLFEIKRIPVVNIWVDVQYLNAGLLLSRQVYLCIHITGIAVLIQATAALGSDMSYAGCRDKAESLSSRPWTPSPVWFLVLLHLDLQLVSAQPSQTVQCR